MKHKKNIKLLNRIRKIKNNNKKKFKLKEKIINHLMTNGKKRTSENIFLKCLKYFQKISNKNYKNIIKLGITNATPTFLLKTVTKKKKRKKKETIIPFLPKKKIRISHAIKTIIKETTKQKKNVIKKHYTNLTLEILLSAKKESETIKKKIEIQKEVIQKKKRLSRFRWF